MVKNPNVRVAVCETQPVTTAGLKCLIDACEDLQFSAGYPCLAHIADIKADVVLIDKAFGMQAVVAWLAEARAADGPLAGVVWGNPITEAESLRLLQAGATGIVPKTAPPYTVLACLRTVATGQSWMQDSVFQPEVRQIRRSRSELTSRERQVLDLVEQGYKNRDIAMELAIRPGTVKIHLKHIFEKTGIRGRYGLALNGLKQKGLLLESAQVLSGGVLVS
jgi:two-component system, NarL family, nitrate/nitrite response regulator NarL